jgi:hypothetical protein
MSVPRLQAEGFVMSVVIRNVGGASQWTCTVVVGTGRDKKPCLHKGVADTEQNARREYEAHKRQVH